MNKVTYSIAGVILLIGGWISWVIGSGTIQNAINGDKISLYLLLLIVVLSLFNGYLQLVINITGFIVNKLKGSKK